MRSGGTKFKSSAGFVTVGAAFALVATTVAILAGLGASNSKFAFGSGFAWLGSDENGQVVLANGSTGQGTAKVNVPDAKGKNLRVEQRDGHAVVVVDDPDGSSRVLYRLDDKTGTNGSQRTVTQKDEILQGGGRAYLINHDDGTVQPINPDTLEPDGKPLKFEPPVLGSMDDDGRVIVVESSKGRASVVQGSQASEPRPIGSGGDDFSVATIGRRPVVVNASKPEAIVYTKGEPTRVSIPQGEGRLTPPANGEGQILALLRINGDRGDVILVNLEDGSAHTVSVSAGASTLRPPLVSDDAVYLVDPQAGSVKVIDPRSGAVIADTPIGTGKGDQIEAFVKDGFLWVNDPKGSTATVVDRKGRPKQVDKYDKKIPDLNPVDPAESPDPGPAPDPSLEGPPAPTPIPQPSNAPPPVANAPAAPSGLAASPSNAKVFLTWAPGTDGGSPLTGYRLVCSPDCGGASEQTIAAGQATATVENLTNGTEYKFRLYASNALGESAPATASATPTADVPPKPTNVRASANPDGTVEITWQSSSEGLRITGFTITGSSNGTGLDGPASATFSVQGGQATQYKTTAGTLGTDLDSQGDYTFTVQSSAQPRSGGASLLSEPSDRSNAVDVYQPPSWDASQSIQVTSTGDKTAALKFPPAKANGRQTSYTVEQCQGSSVAQCSASWVPANASPVSALGQYATTAITGLENRKAYFFRVQARNDAGSAVPPISTNIAAIPAAPKPTAVTVAVLRLTVSTVRVTPTVAWAGQPGSVSLGGTQFSGSLDTSLPTGGNPTVTVTACSDPNDALSCLDGSTQVDMQLPQIVFGSGGQTPCVSGGIPARTGATWGVGWTLNTHNVPASQFSGGHLSEIYSDGQTFPKNWDAPSLSGSTGGWGDLGLAPSVTVWVTIAGIGEISDKWQGPTLHCP